MTWALYVKLIICISEQTHSHTCRVMICHGHFKVSRSTEVPRLYQAWMFFTFWLISIISLRVSRVVSKNFHIKASNSTMLCCQTCRFLGVSPIRLNIYILNITYWLFMSFINSLILRYLNIWGRIDKIIMKHWSFFSSFSTFYKPYVKLLCANIHFVWLLIRCYDICWSLQLIM